MEIDARAIISEIRGERCGYNTSAFSERFRGDLELEVTKLPPLALKKSQTNKDITLLNNAIEKLMDGTAASCILSFAETPIEPIITVSKLAPPSEALNLPSKASLFNHIRGDSTMEELEPPSREVLSQSINTFYPNLQSKSSIRIDLLNTLSKRLDQINVKRSDCSNQAYNSRQLKSIGTDLGIPEAGSRSKKDLVHEIKRIISLHTKG